MRTNRMAPLLLAAALVLPVAVFSACGGGAATQPSSGTDSSTGAPALDGTTLLQERCTQCHDLDRVKQAQKTLAEWETTVQQMRGHGAVLTDEEAQTLVQYLAETYGK